MDYRKYGETCYVRLDRGDDIIACLLHLCEKEDIPSAVFTGIGGCGEAEIQTFIPETALFEKQRIQGMLELVSLTGNIVTDDDGQHYHHTHALFTYKDGSQHCTAGGHDVYYRVLYCRNRISPCYWR